jgi:hypothetical protein
VRPHWEEDLRALALISLGSTEIWAGQYEEGCESLPQGVALAHQVGRPFLEFTGLAELAVAEIALPFAGETEIWRPLPARLTAPGRRSSWPGGMAGPTSRPSASPVGPLDPRWPGRYGPRRPNHGSCTASAP